MKKVLKIVLVLLGVVIVVLGVGVIYFLSTYPKTKPAPEVKITGDSIMIARGSYLANHVAVCIDCHSTRDFSKYAGPYIHGTEGKGGDVFNEDLGFPGTIYAKNITPYALKNWTDGELLRVITTGVNKDGKVLFPVMPYLGYNKMSKYDLYSIIAFIRTLKPVESSVPESQINFPVNLIIRTVPPEEYIPMPEPDMKNSANYGKYLVTIAACGDCHTQQEKGKFLEGMEFAGGRKFKTPGFDIFSANITPDKETGIGSWKREDFVNRFKAFESDSSHNIKLNKDDFNTMMPWTMYAGMTTSDLGAIYDYLMTIKPVKNGVTHFVKH